MIWIRSFSPALMERKVQGLFKPALCISNSIAGINCFKISHYVAAFDFTIAVLCLSLQTAPEILRGRHDFIAITALITKPNAKSGLNPYMQ
jgi:hypothetical protein